MPRVVVGTSSRGVDGVFPKGGGGASDRDVGQPPKRFIASSQVSSLQAVAHLTVLLPVEGDLIAEKVLVPIEALSLVGVDAEVCDVGGEPPIKGAADLRLEEVVVVGDLEEIEDPSR